MHNDKEAPVLFACYCKCHFWRLFFFSSCCFNMLLLHAGDAQWVPLCQCSATPAKTPNHFALLGVLAQMVDDVASQFVYHDSTCRPRGHLTLNILHDMEQHDELNSSSKHKWHQFLQVWLDAGWRRFDLIVMVDELRPLLWGHPQPQSYIATIDAKQMAYSSMYSCGQGHRHVELQKALHELLDIVQTHFSSPSAVLVPAADVCTRLSNVYMPGLNQNLFTSEP